MRVLASAPIVENSPSVGKNLPRSVQPMEINVQRIKGF